MEEILLGFLILFYLVVVEQVLDKMDLVATRVDMVDVEYLLI